jgi:hypothetical protein
MQVRNLRLVERELGIEEDVEVVIEKRVLREGRGGGFAKREIIFHTVYV